MISVKLIIVAPKEAFTTADKYVVSINPGVEPGAKKIAVIAAALTIDMVLKESR
ncbi:MAG: hypothetical protein LBG07_11710 [Treponema sp.]|jgi:hypothetical protein|nr:hypothetical protein [Treponema sp.]